MQSIKVALADKQALTRVGLKSFIQEKTDLDLLDEVDSLQDLKETLTRYQPEVLLVDYNLRDFVSIKDLREVSKLSPNTRILIISSDNNKSNIFEVLEIGISGYVTKECSKHEIVGAIYATAKGEKFFCNKVLDLILEKHLKKEEADECLPTELSVREVEVVKWTASGLNAKQIADKLHLSHHTVYTHRKNVMKKLALGSVSELTLYAVKTGIINA
ncbi:MAG: putative two-component response regulator [Cyclobacteriaceae bacterium]|nr:MAG: putative two-component response regulator [Cyclobacteriaceae bacterium]